jgi:hypothetical protein
MSRSSNRVNFGTGGFVNPFEGLQSAIGDISKSYLQQEALEREEKRLSRAEAKDQARFDLQQSRLDTQEAWQRQKYDEDKARQEKLDLRQLDKDKLAEITSQLMGCVSIEHSKVNRNRLLHRLHHKLIAVSVGRITLSNIINGPKPKCWAAGFSGLHNRPYVGHSLRTFDRLRADAKRDLGRRTKGLLLNDLSAPEDAPSSRHETSYYGYPYSYEKQLQNAGGQELIFSPYRTTKLDDLVLTISRCVSFGS